MIGGAAGGEACAAVGPRAARPRGGVAGRTARRRARLSPIGAASDNPPVTAATAGAGSLDRAIDDYLTYLRVERGVADATIRAYRGDLSDFASSRGAACPLGDGPGDRAAATSASACPAGAPQRPRPRPDQPPPPGGGDPRLLPVRLR